MRRFVAALALCLLAPAAPALAQAGTWLPSQVVMPQGQSFLSGFPDGSGFAYHTSGGPVAIGTSVGAGATLFHTEDFGATWEGTFAPETGATESVRFGTPQLGYTIGNGLMFRTEDGAATWKPIPGPKLPLEAFLSMSGSIAAHGRSVMLGAIPTSIPEMLTNQVCMTPTHIYTSHDAGDTWIDAVLPVDGARVSVLETLDERHAVALAYEMSYDAQCSGVSTRNMLFVTEDGGRSWREVLDCGEYCTSAAMVAPGRLIAGFRDGRILRSEDGGRSFSETSVTGSIPPPPGLEAAYWVSGIDFADCEVGYAGTNGRGTFRTDDGGKTWDAETSPQSVWGIGVGHLAAFDRMHAIAGGPNVVAYRTPGEGERPEGTDEPCPVAPASATGSGGGSGGSGTGTAPPPATAPPSRTPATALRLRLTPSKVRPGRRTRVTVTVLAGGRPVEAATVRAGRASATTDRRGRAVLRLRVGRGKRLVVSAEHPAHGVRTSVLRASKR